MTDELWRVRSLEHPALAVMVPVGFLWFALLAMRSMFPELPLAPGLLILMVLAAIAESVVGNILAARQIGGFLPLLREILVVVAAVYLCLKIVNGRLFTGDWGVDAEVGIGMALTLLTWFLSHVLHQALRPRELLLASVLAAHGGNTQEAVRELGSDAADAAQGMRKARRLIAGLQIVGLVLLFIVTVAAGQGVDPMVVVVGFLHAASGVAAFLVVTGHMESHTLLGRGFSPPGSVADRRTVFVVALCVLACLLTLALAGREAPLPARYLEEFLAWLGRIFAGRGGPARVAPPDPSGRSQVSFLPEPRLPPIPEVPLGPGNPILERVLRIIVIALVFGLPGAGLAAAVLAPVFRRHEGRLYPIRALRSWLARAAQAFARRIERLARVPRGPHTGRPERSARRRTGGMRDGPRRGVLEGLALGRELRLFVRVVRWGERQGVPFRSSLGPREYTQLLGTSVPEVGPPLERLAEILEETLYSGARPAPGRTLEYVNTARRVLRYRP